MPGSERVASTVICCSVVPTLVTVRFGGLRSRVLLVPAASLKATTWGKVLRCGDKEDALK